MPAMLKAWPNGEKLAVSIVVNVEEGAERNVVDGDSGPEPVDELGVALKGPIRNFANESNYRYGIEAGAARVFGALDRFGLCATVTAAARALERSPGLAATLRGSRHEICAHGLRWVLQHKLGADEEREFIRAAAVSIERSVGVRPVGWLSRYLFTENTRALLAEEGFLYHMDDYGADRPFWAPAGARRIVVLPYALDTNDMKLWTAPALSPRQWAEYAIDSFDWLMREASESAQMMSLGVHLRIIGRPGRIGAFERVLAHIAAAPGAWVATRRAIAEHFVRTVEPTP